MFIHMIFFIIILFPRLNLRNIFVTKFLQSLPLMAVEIHHTGPIL